MPRWYGTYGRSHSALGCAGSWRQAADRMHLHLNTVRYRIGRVEELTGRDLGRLDDRLDLYLAVRARSRPGALPA
ncbi:helix-turn-helix domain-containing protein [Nocardia terpenica]|uniref:helix-turn-helix domain-containing protein n=1 Tax=Nocardia terpenica TaxID=455432 RepID=UPI001E4F0C95|nr:helix-turn-helix domain-containing protein [Nocardia terpenica]